MNKWVTLNIPIKPRSRFSKIEYSAQSRTVSPVRENLKDIRTFMIDRTTSPVQTQRVTRPTLTYRPASVPRGSLAIFSSISLIMTSVIVSNSVIGKKYFYTKYVTWNFNTDDSATLKNIKKF